MLKSAGVEAEVDVYHTDMHAFDMLRDDDLSREATDKFERSFEHALGPFVSSKEIHPWSGYGIS